VKQVPFRGYADIMSTQGVKLLQKISQNGCEEIFSRQTGEKSTVPVELQGSSPLYTIWWSNYRTPNSLCGWCRCHRYEDNLVFVDVLFL